MPFYGTQKFDPKLIVGQIFVLQTLFYMVEGLLLFIFYILFGSNITLDSIFYYKFITISNTRGWSNIFIMLLSSGFLAYSLIHVVERAKKCLDFSFTLFFLHFLFCWVYGGFPGSFVWWVVNISCLVLMTVCGEQLCMREEQKDIQLQ
jgi:protein SYS1